MFYIEGAITHPDTFLTPVCPVGVPVYHSWQENIRTNLCKMLKADPSVVNVKVRGSSPPVITLHPHTLPSHPHTCV